MTDELHDPCCDEMVCQFFVERQISDSHAGRYRQQAGDTIVNHPFMPAEPQQMAERGMGRADYEEWQRDLGQWLEDNDIPRDFGEADEEDIGRHEDTPVY